MHNDSFRPTLHIRLNAGKENSISAFSASELLRGFGVLGSQRRLEAARSSRGRSPRPWRFITTCSRPTLPLTFSLTSLTLYPARGFRISNSNNLLFFSSFDWRLARIPRLQRRARRTQYSCQCHVSDCSGTKGSYHDILLSLVSHSIGKRSQS